MPVPLVEQARAAWPGVRVDDTAFTSHVGRLGPGLDPDAGPDLWLAFACAAHDPAALGHLDALLRAEIPKAVGHLDSSADFAAEIQQLLTEKLIVATPPRILDFAGRGRLSAWLRVAALRTALSLKRVGPRAVPDDDLGALPALDDPELEAIRRRYGAEFKQALSDAFGALSSRDRNLLRMHVLEKLTFEQLAAHHRAHRTSITRWLELARQTLLDQTRARLEQKLQLTRPEFDSLVRLLHSQVDVSLPRLLAASDRT